VDGAIFKLIMKVQMIAVLDSDETW